MNKLLIVLLLSIATFSCRVPKEETPVTEYTPVMMQRSQLEASVIMEPARAMMSAGKLYMKDNYVLINDKYTGIHVIDNSNPALPVKKAFIKIPGCIDMAVKGNIMYVDNATDLVGIDVSDMNNMHQVSRIPNAFPELLPPDLGYLPDVYTAGKRPEGFIIVGWKKN